MHDAAGVRGRKAGGQLSGDGQRRLQRQPAFAVEAAVERLAVHQVHADEPAVLVPGDVMDAHHVRAGHLAGKQQFLAETFEGLGSRGELRAQQLYRHRHVQVAVAGQVDHAHAADAQHADDLETAGQHRAGQEFGAGVLAGHGFRETAAVGACHGRLTPRRRWRPASGPGARLRPGPVRCGGPPATARRVRRRQPASPVPAL